MIAAALRGALSDRARDGRIHVVETFGGEKPSTKAALKALESVAGSRVLVVLTRDEDIAWLSLRNVASVHLLSDDQLNAYDVLVADDVVFSAAALEAYVAGPAKGKSVQGRGDRVRSRGGRQVSDALKIRDHRDILLAPVVSREELRAARREQVHVPRRAGREQDRDQDRRREGLRRQGHRRSTRSTGRARSAARAPARGKRPDTKRAIVTVAEGQRIDIFGQAN